MKSIDQIKKETRNEALVDTYHMLGVIFCLLLITYSAFF